MRRLEELIAEARERPDDPRAWSRLAEALVDHGHARAAREALERAVGLDPDPITWIRVGAVLERLDDPTRAAEAYRAATRPGGPPEERAEAYVYLGRVLLRLDQTDTAALGLRVAVRLAPDHGGAHLVLAEVLERSGDLEEAEEHATRAVELGFDSPAPHRRLAGILERRGRIDEAAEALRRLIAVAPGAADAPLDLADLLARAGRVDEARRLLVEVGADLERTPDNLFRVGRSRAAVGDHAGALEALRETARLRPHHGPTQLALGESLETAGLRSEAVVAYRAAVTLEPGSATAHHRIGRLLLELDRLDDAVRHLVQGVSLDPNDADLQAALAAALARRSGDRRGASEGSFSGDLSVFPLPEMLEFLLIQRATGLVRVDTEGQEGWVELRGGRIAAAWAPGSTTLRARLAARGIRLPDAGDDGPRPGDDADLARWVAERAFLSEAVIVREVSAAVQDALSIMVSWREGQVRFHSAPDDRAETAELDDLTVDPRWILLELARRQDER